MPGKSKATASLVCGIISVVFAWFGYSAIVGLILGIVAIVLAVQAKKEGFEGGLQKAGLVLGIIGAVLCGVMFVACTLCVICVGAAGGLTEIANAMY